MSCGRKIGPFDCCSVVQGDCLELMAALPNGCVDAVITSPPYNKGLRTDGDWTGRVTETCKSSRFRDGYQIHSDAMPLEAYESWQGEVLEELWRLIPSDGAIFYNHKPRILNGHLWTPLEFQPCSVFLRQIVIWHCGTGVNMNPGAFMPAHEWIMLFAKNDYRLAHRERDSAVGDVWEIRSEPSNEHPCPFPEMLTDRLVYSTCGLVLDPFCGTGTTLVSAKRQGRHFLGMELYENYCRIARERIAAIEAQPNLFQPSTAEQLTLQ